MADYNSKYSGEQVEALLDQVASGNAGGGGGGGITVETDPIFSNSPAATITEADKSAWGGKQDAISDLATIRSGASKGATSVQPDDIEDFVKSSELADVAYTADYNELENKPTFKSINGESVVGSGNITIAGGSGEKGEKGEKGDKGDTGVGVQSVAQTTTSNADGGSNVVTVTLTNGTKSTFTVKNGSKGSQGIQGEQGPKGDKGDTGANGANGTNGVSVSSVKQTTTSTADGGTNVVTVTLSNGTTSTFSVKNGSKGSNGTNGTNGKDGADGEDGATFTPSVDSAGNLSWTNNKGLTNPPTVNIKGPKGDKGDTGEGGGGSSGGEGVIQWTMRYAPDYTNDDGVINLDPFVVYYGGFFPSGGTIYLNSNADYNEWRIIFYIYPNCSLNFEVDEWVNGITPDISKGGIYELSIVENDGVGLGIIAHFPVE